MLKNLVIKDYALIENIDIQFGKGLNIITGETGAGKSILIDAMGLLLGERASTQVVRKDATKSIVEGIFDVTNNKKIKSLLSNYELDYSDELIIRREISLKGSNRCFINDTPVQLSVIQEFGNLIVDLHGQHDHQSLLRNSTHIEFLDEYVSIDKSLDEFRKYYDEISEINKELFLLRNKEKSVKEETESIQYQLKEINNVNPSIEEEEELKQQLNLLENSERLLELTTKIYGQMYESENSAHDILAEIQNDLQELSEIDTTFSEKTEEIVSAINLVKDISDFVRSYKDKIDIDPSGIDAARERLGSLTLLKKRYGGTIEKVLEHRDSLEQKMSDIENYDGKISELESRLDVARKKAGEVAFKISEKRKNVAGIIQNEVESELNTLGINDAKFSAKVISNEAAENAQSYLIHNDKKYKFNARGIDEVEFLISTNLGEDLKPLSKIASGGEISRIMLALKSILAKSDKLPLLIFDEIDVGVSGRIAQKVGESLLNLCKFHQIISITHLPQIAGQADHHYAVEKKKIGSRVVSSIRQLNKEESINEVAKLLSGEKVTEASLKSARELIDKKNGA